jgi:hypothetical protein
MNSREQEYEAIVKQMSRIDEMGIEVCIVCDCAIEYNKCLCDMSGSIDKNWCW